MNKESSMKTAGRPKRKNDPKISETFQRKEPLNPAVRNSEAEKREPQLQNKRGYLLII